MRKITEEARAVLNCYGIKGKQALIQELETGIKFTDSVEMKALMMEGVTYLKRCTRSEYLKLWEYILLDVSEDDLVE